MGKGRFFQVLTLAVLALALWAIKPTVAAAQVTQTSVLSVTVGSAASLSVTTPTTLTNAGGFTDFTGTTTSTFSVRTTASTGSGTLTVSFAADWSSQPNGPSILGSPTQLSYACGALGGGPPLTNATPCSGTQSVNALSPSTFNVVTFGANSKVNNGTEVQSWTLVNQPSYQTGTYTTTATYTLTVS